MPLWPACQEHVFLRDGLAASCGEVCEQARLYAREFRLCAVGGDEGVCIAADGVAADARELLRAGGECLFPAKRGIDPGEEFSE